MVTLDNLVSGTIGALLGSVVGSLVMVWHNRSELRRAERLVVAERVHEALSNHSLNTLLAWAPPDWRSFDALVDLQPWHRRRAVRRCVENYKKACRQDWRRDDFGQMLATDRAAIDAAIAALMPHTAHR